LWEVETPTCLHGWHEICTKSMRNFVMRDITIYTLSSVSTKLLVAVKMHQNQQI